MNGRNHMHDVPNGFPTDGTHVASSANQNLSLTYIAFAARAAAYAVEQLGRK